MIELSRLWRHGACALTAALFLYFASSASGAIVNYTQRTGYFSATWTQSGGLYDQGTTEVGMWASSASGFSVGWRPFRVSDGTGGSQRELQVGDRFRISVYGHRVFGKFGVSISRNPSTGSWNNRTNNTYGFIEMTNYGDFVANYEGGQSAFSGATLFGEDGSFEFFITSTSNFIANVNDNGSWQTPKYDLDFIGNPGTSLVTHWSQYYNDDWDGTQRRDSYWKATTTYQLSITNMGYVEFGTDNGTRTIGGRIQDGLSADSTSTLSTNNLLKKGSGTITLGETNNLHTGYTEIQNGTLKVAADGSFGVVPAGGWRSGRINIWSSGTLQFSEDTLINTNRGLTFGNTDGPSISVDATKTVTFSGVVEGAAAWNKTGSGTLFLNGNASTNKGKVTIQGGTLRVAATGSFGRIVGTTNIANIWSSGTLEFTNTWTLAAGAVIEIGNVSGPVVSVQDQSTITWGGAFGGNAGWSKQGLGTLILSGSHTNAGPAWVSNGILRITHANGLGTTANGTTVVNGPSLQVDGGITTAAEPLTLNGEGWYGGGALDSVSGSNTFAGPITLGLHSRIRAQTAGLVLNSSTAIGGSGWNLEGAGGGDIHIASVVGTGTGLVKKIDAGMLALNNTNNTYSGGTTVSGGIVRIGFNGSLGATPGSATPNHIRLDNGTLMTTNGGAWTLAANRGLGLGHLGGIVSNVGGAVTYSGIIAGNGPLTYARGSWIIGGANTYTGRTVFAGGTVSIDADTRLGAAPTGNTVSNQIVFNGGTLAITTGFTMNTNRGVTLTGNGTVDVASGQTFVMGSPIVGGGTFTKTGAGTLTLNGRSTNSGATTISAGTLNANHTNTASAITISAGATMCGTGNVDGVTVTGEVDPGSAGNAVGELKAVSLTLSAVGTNRIDMSNASGTAGSGWDLITVGGGGGTVTINSSVGNEFVIRLDSMGGTPTGWDSSQPWSWKIMDAGSLSGFAANKFRVVTNDFTASTGGGTFSVSESSGDLMLVFTPSYNPDISVLGTNGATITDGDTSPAIADGTDFGYVDVNGSNRTFTFTITNSGAAALSIDTVAVGGTHASDFTISAQPDTWVVSNMMQTNPDFELGASGWSGPGGNSEFRGEYWGLYPKRGTNFLTMWANELCYYDVPVEAGTNYFFSTWIAAPVNDGLSGDVHGEVKVEWYNSSGAFISGTFCSFGTNGSYDRIIPSGAWYNYTTNVVAPVGAVTARLVQVVWNWGSGGGRAAYDHVQFFRQPGLNKVQTFNVTFDPSAAGTRSATLYMTNNVSGKSPYNFDVQGYGIDLVAPTGARVSVDGHEMTRLDWTNSRNAGVIVVHNRTNPPAALSQGTLYSKGDAVGSDGSMVVAKLATNSWPEHIVPAASTSFYTFYSYTDSVYSAGITLGATTQPYYVTEIYDQLCYTGAVEFSTNLAGGYGWSGSWTSWPGFTIVSNDTPSRPELNNMAGYYPQRGGNRIRLAAPGANTAKESYRSFPPISTGLVYFAGRMSFQNLGLNRWCGFSVRSGTTHKIFFGETWSANGFLGIIDYTNAAESAASQTGTNVLSSWSVQLTNTYLLIAKYNFETREFATVAYPGWMSVPPDEPIMPVSDTLGANYLKSIDGIGPHAGSSAAGADIGECFFDEIRVTRSWNDLFRSTTPHLTNYSVGTAYNVYDGEITSGVFTVSATAEDTNGVGTAGMDFDIMNPAGVQILTNEHVDTQTWSNGGKTSIGSDSSHAGYYPGTLGTYTARWSVVNSNGFWAYDKIALTNNTIMTFTVTDDDTSAPVHSSFTGHGRTLSGATYTNSELGSGLSITGLVTDAESGVFGGTSNAYVLYRSGSSVASGNMTANFANGTAVSSNGQLTLSVAAGTIQVSGNYTLQVISVSHDIDRDGDAEVVTNRYAFSVVGPEIAVLGINHAVITDGDTTPNTTDGTDFGALAVTGATLDRNFYITNSGNTALIISGVTTQGAHASDFVVVSWPASVDVATRSNLVVRFDPSAAGLRTASVHIANSDSDEADYDFVVRGTNLATPTAQSATADGYELVRVNWTPDTSYGTVMVLHKQTNAISVDPTQNTSYAVGDIIDGARVLYKGTGTGLEHVVTSGSINYYAFYSVNGNYYSTSALANVTMLSYPSGVMVEPFAYTNGVSPSGRGGGNGFTNNWSVSVPSAGDVAITNSNFSTFQAQWPAETANRLIFRTTNSAGYQAFRGIPQVTGGKVYVAAQVRRQFGEGATDFKYSGISLMDGATELTFVGDRGAGDDQFGVSFNSGPNALYGAANSFPEATDYLVIGRYDFGSGIWAGLYYDNATPVPATEPSFLIQVTQALTRVTGIRLAAGASSGWPGEVYFDEVRVATNWGELLRSTLPNVVSTSLVVNAGTNVSDAQVTSGAFSVSMHFYDDSGIESTNTSGSYFKPNFDILNNGGTQILSNEIFSSFTYSGDYLAASDASHVGAQMSAVDLGTYSVRWSAINSNAVSVTDSTTLSNLNAMSFTVYDDDTNPPLVGVTSTNNIIIDPGSVTNGFISSVGWFGYNEVGVHAWADRAVLPGTNGIAWQSWTDGNYGGFGHNLVYNPTNGNVFHFSMYGNAEANFSSTVHEAWMKMEFVDPSGAILYTSSNSVYNTLVSNRNTWVLFNLGATNQVSGVATVRVVVGYGNAFINGGGSYAVKWDDGTWYQGHQMQVRIGSTNISSYDGRTNGIFQLTDGQLAGVGVNNPMKLTFGVYDAESGLSRGNENAATQMNVDVGAWLTDNVTNYVASNSTAYAGTFAAPATSTWAFYDVDVDTLMFLTNAVTLSAPDADFDRSSDQAWLTNQLYGYLAVSDDDDTPPQVGSGHETNVLSNASFELGDGTTVISNWYRSAGNTEHREGQASSGYLTDTAIPNGTNILKMFGTAAELVQTNIPVVAGAFYHAYGQFYHSSTNDAICQTCGEDSLGAFFKVIFYNSSQAPVATNFSGEHNASVPSNVWQYINLYVTAPTNAATATFHVQTSGGTNNVGALYADDFNFTRDARVMQVWVGTNNVSALNDGGTNGVHTLYDTYYAGIAATNKLRIVIGAYDTNSGLDQASINLDWENWLTDNTTNFVSTNSSTSAETYDPTATNVWVFTQVDFASAFNKTNRITVSLFDNDNDRSNDKIIVTNQQYGYIAVLDDDVDAPTATAFVATGTAAGTVTVSQVQNGGWSLTGLVRDVYSGINVNGGTTSDSQNNISPYFSVYNSTGTAIIVQYFTNRPSDGGATNWTRLAMETVTNTVALGSIPSGTYTVRVTVADNDEDRTNATERALLSGYDACTFVVPGAPGLGRGPSTLNLTSYFGSAVSGTFAVTNIGSGSLTYSAAISYTGVGGWLDVLPSNGVLPTAASQIHTASVNVAGLESCSYQATITLTGNQTNSAQTIVVNLTVIGFDSGEIVEAFTNSAGLLNGDGGGNGWTNTWEDAPANSVTTKTTNLSVPGNYPAAVGGKVELETGNDGTAEKSAHRHFQGVSAGKIFIAAAVKKSRNNNTAGFFGLSMFDGTTEKAFFGKRFGEEWFGVEVDQAGYGCSSSFGMYQTTYFIVGMYDFDTDIIKGAVYNSGDNLPLTEAGVAWRCSNNISASPITLIDAVRVAGKDVETAEFDEIRVASSWEGLLGLGSDGDEPTLDGSLMRFNNVATNQMDVSWNSGNGSRRLVIGREGAAVTFSPTDHVQYAANTNFSLATNYSGNRILFDGSATNITVVGLNPGTNYYFKIFEYNTCGTNLDYLTSGTPVASNQWTLVPEPANQPTAFAAWQVSSSSISNTWVASAGSPSPSAYLVVYGTNEPGTAPSDGTAYTDGQALGSNGTVAIVAPGSATKVLHTGLGSCESYVFRIYAFTTNTGGAQTYNYLTVGAPTSTAATACTDPTLQASNITFSAVDTNELTVSWLNGNGQYRIVVVRATNAVDAMPSDGTSYSASAVFGSGGQVGTANYVVYNGTGTTLAISNLLPGVTYHVRVFEYNGSGNAANYITNTAVGNPASRATAAFGIAYDEFDDQGAGSGQITDASRNDGGEGWTNNWTQNFDAEIIAGGNMPAFKCYPRVAGSDILRMADDGFTHDVKRHFPRRTSGRIYAAYLVNIAAGGVNTFAGLSFYNGSGETGYFGKIYSSSSNVLGVAHNGTNFRSDYAFGLGSGNDYLVVGMYDFETDVLSAKAYTTNFFASVDPSRTEDWDIQMSNVVIDAIDGVRLAKQNTGITYFDEVRIGATWEQVMVDEGADPDSGPVPTLIYIGPSYSGGAIGGPVVTNLTDADLVSTSRFDFAVRWDDPNGVYVTNGALTSFYASGEANVIPNWDPLAPGAATNSYGADNLFTNFFGINGASSVTTYQRSAFLVTNLDLTQPYFVTVSAQDWPSCVGCTHVAPVGEPVPCSRAIRINTPLRFYTSDDDSEPPTMGTNLLTVMQGGTIAPYTEYSGTSALRRYFLTDGSLTSQGFSASLNVYDTSSGVRRATAGPHTNLNVSINQFVTNEIGSYSPANSHADTRQTSSTSVWNFAASNFTYTRVGDMFGSGATDLQVVADAPDMDSDRTNDITWSSNMLFGYLRIQDDDAGTPVLTNIAYAGSTTSNRSFWVVTNGYLANTSLLAGTDTNTQWTIYDGDLANPTSGYLRFAIGATDTDSGVDRGTTGDTNSVMSVSIGDIIEGNYTNYNAAASTPNAAGQALTNVWSFSGALGDAVITGLMAAASNEVKVTIPDSDNDRTNDRSTLASARVGWLKVLDDDTNRPTLGVNPLTVMAGGTALEVWTNAGTTNVVYRVSDGQFYSASPGNPLAFSFNVFDTSGIRRATVGASTNMNIDIQNFATNDVAHYSAAKSTADPRTAGATSVWEWTSGGDQGLVSNLFGEGTIGLTNRVAATIRDDDTDWTGDDLTLATQQFGYIWMYDDDTNYPERANLLGENLLTNGSFEIEGWWSGAANGWDATNFPNDRVGATFGNYLRADFRSRSGGYSASIPGQQGSHVNTGGGWYQDVTNANGAGTIWKASAWTISDNGWTANYAAVSIEFYQGDHSTRVGAVTNNFGIPSNGWQYVSVVGTAPVDAAFARIVLTADALGTNGSIYFDNAVLQLQTNQTLPMDIVLGNHTRYLEGAGSNGVFSVTDDDLANVGPTNLLKFIYRVYDATSGVGRTNAYELMNYDIGSVGSGTQLNNIFWTYTNDLSSSDSRASGSTSVFAHVQNFSLGGVHSGTNFNETGDVVRLITAGSNLVTVSYPDADDDRGLVDRLWVVDQQFGYLKIEDDDSTGPVATLKYIGSAYTPGALATNDLTDAEMLGAMDFAVEWVDASGLFITNHDGSQVVSSEYGNVSMNWDLVGPDAVVYASDIVHPATSIFSIAGNGSIYATAVQYNATQITYTNNQVGTWTLRGSAQDDDNDRGAISHNNQTVKWDRAIRANIPMTFRVRDDDSNHPSANNLAINGRYATNVIYDGELSTGFSVRVRFWDDQAGTYMAAANGAFAPPNFDILNPSNQLVQTNQAFGSLGGDTDLQLVNAGFETAGTNTAQGLADRWDAICYEPPALWFRSNGVGRSGSYALAADYTSAVTNHFGEVMHQWISATNIAAGETFVFGGWVKVSNSIAGNGRTLLKFEWWDTGTTNGCPGGNQIGYTIGHWVQNTGNDWSNYVISGVKPSDSATWVKVIVEGSFVDAIITSQKIYWDDMYLGSPSNILALASAVTVPYSNIFLGDYTFRWSAQDSDNDRTNDTLGYTDATNMGYGVHIFNVQDDQPGGPTGMDLFCNGYDKEWTNGVVRDQQIRNGQWQMAFRLIDPSGVATSGVGDDWAPNFSLLNAAGATVQAQRAFSSLAGDPTNVVCYKTMDGVLYTEVDTGLYSIAFSAQNLDNDRPNDRGALTNFIGMGQGDGAYGASHQFLVVDDDTNGPTVPTNVSVSVTAWTNVNLFNITFHAATDDYSGIYQYRYDTNVTPSATVSNGDLVSGVATTTLPVPAFSNANFEIGGHGEVMPENPANLHGWQDYSSDNATGQYWAIGQSGTGAMRHVIAAGNNAGSPRYSLIGQQVSIDNTNGYPVLVSMSAWFSGNVSRVGNGVTGAAFMKMEFFDASTTLIYTVDNEYGSDHNGNPLFGVNTPAWTNVLMTATNGPANTRFIRFMCGIGQHYTDLPYTGYWDNVVLTVKVVGAVGNAYSFEMTNALEGVRTNWLFAVDDDNDRVNDRIKGGNTSYVTRLDLTPPARVANFVGTNGLDESSEVTLNWTALTNAGHRASDGDPLSPWRTYYVFYTTNANVTTNDASVSFTNAGYGALNTNTATTIMLTNLEFDTTYRFVIAGQDRAGNLGPLSDTTEVTTLSFIVTQGLVNATGQVNVSWKAATGRVYDVLWEDALGFDNTTTSLWTRLWTNMMGRVTNSWLLDTGDTNRVVPRELGATMRFYRVSREGQWATNASIRRASKEIYVAKSWRLAPGENWLSMPFLPDTNRFTVKEVFGTNLLPRGATVAQSTKISWYGHTLGSSTNSSGVATNVIWLSSTQRWYYAWPAQFAGQVADDFVVPTNEGFNIEIPTTVSTQQYVMAGRLPTNIMTMTIYGATGQTNYSILSWGTPYRVKVKELGLIGAGFTGGVNVTRSDEIRILDNSRGFGSRMTPKARIWRNNSTNFYLSPSGVLANDYIIEPGDAVIIVRKRGPSLMWTNQLYYLPPGKNINP
jgi:autotransporter-associated beta strand protein